MNNNSANEYEDEANARNNDSDYENEANNSNAPNNGDDSSDDDIVENDGVEENDDVSMSISLGCNATLAIPVIITALVYWFLKYQLQRESKIPPIVLIILLLVAAMGAQSSSCFLLKSSLAKFSVSAIIGVVVPVFLFLFFYISQ